MSIFGEPLSSGTDNSFLGAKDEWVRGGWGPLIKKPPLGALCVYGSHGLQETLHTYLVSCVGHIVGAAR